MKFVEHEVQLVVKATLFESEDGGLSKGPFVMMFEHYARKFNLLLSQMTLFTHIRCINE